jgi:hypothetical protein
MSEKEKASLAFPVTCMLISFAFTTYLHRTWISQQIRACKRFTRHASRKTKRLVSYWTRWLHHITNNWLGEIAARTYNILKPPWDSDTSSNSPTNLDVAFNSDTSTATSANPSPPFSPSLTSRPTWILDSNGQYILNQTPEPLPRAQWEIELDERIRNGRGPGAWLDRTVDWVVRQVVADLDADMRAEIDRFRGDRRGMVQM